MSVTSCIKIFVWTTQLLVPQVLPLFHENLCEGRLQQRDERSIANKSLASARFAHALARHPIYEEGKQKKGYSLSKTVKICRLIATILRHELLRDSARDFHTVRTVLLDLCF